MAAPPLFHAAHGAHLRSVGSPPASTAAPPTRAARITRSDFLGGKCPLALGPPDGDFGRSGRHSCAAAPVRAAAPAGAVSGAEGGPGMEPKEAHKLFDRVFIAVKAGDGGNGAVLRLPRAPLPGQDWRKGGKQGREQLKKEKEKKRQLTQLRKDASGLAILPQGGHGGDIILVADPRCSTLLPFHAAPHSSASGGPAAQEPQRQQKLRRFVAQSGGNVDSAGSLARLSAEGAPGSPVRIPVPVGTVIKRKRGNKLLADLASPGDEVVVARGGRGGTCIYELPPSRGAASAKLNVPEGATVMRGAEDKELTLGQPGEEAVLELILRVVADVGLVGLPNAGKSSLLSALTAARPQVAPYPFTTLIPNLGKIPGDPETSVDGGYAVSGPTLADLPGLIRGAHMGRGLGRMFLRHLRRTRLLLHLLDAAAEDPVRDYWDLREELRLYNPEYVRRPHIVVLNKMDLPEAATRKDEIVRGLVMQGQAGEGQGAERAGSTPARETLGASSGARGEEADGGRRIPWLEDARENEAVIDVRPGSLPLRMLKDSHVQEDAQGASGQDWSAEEVAWGAGEENQSREHRAGSGMDLWSEPAAETWAGREEHLGWEEHAAEVDLPVTTAAGEGHGAGEHPPVAIVAVSAREGEGLKELLSVIRWAMEQVVPDHERQQQAEAQTAARKGLQGVRGEQGKRFKTPQWRL